MEAAGTEDAAAVAGKKPTKKKNVSLLELNEKAHNRVESIRRANVQKSLEKIKTLTVEHAQAKADGVAIVSKKDKYKSDTVHDPDVIDKNAGSDDEGKKAKGGKREPLEEGAKKQYADKNTVSKSKLVNKRS